MKKYKEVYIKAFGYHEGERFLSELSWHEAIDINHILCRGMGGDKTGEKDRIENLIALTREEHIKYGDKKKYYSMLFEAHRDAMIIKGVKFDEKYINDMIEKYSHYRKY